MNLTEEQKKTVTSWIHEGLKISDVQSRLAAEFGVTLTYMQTRFLIDDLKLVPIDPAPAPTPGPAVLPGQAAGSASAKAPAAEAPVEDIDAELDDPVPVPPPSPAPGGGKVTVSIDKLAVPGALVSGKVTFSDGKSAQWYLDEMGRLGLAPKEKGYRPPAADVQTFQMQLQRELQRAGYA